MEICLHIKSNSKGLDLYQSLVKLVPHTEIRLLFDGKHESIFVATPSLSVEEINQVIAVASDSKAISRITFEGDVPPR